MKNYKIKDDHETLLRLLRLMTKYDDAWYYYWDKDLNFCVNCNDIFSCASDAENVKTIEDIELLEKSYELAEKHKLEDYGIIIYVAKKRNKLPLQNFLESTNTEQFFKDLLSGKISL